MSPIYLKRYLYSYHIGRRISHSNHTKSSQTPRKLRLPHISNLIKQQFDPSQPDWPTCHRLKIMSNDCWTNEEIIQLWYLRLRLHQRMHLQESMSKRDIGADGRRTLWWCRLILWKLSVAQTVSTFHSIQSYWHFPFGSYWWTCNIICIIARDIQITFMCSRRT